MTTHLFIPDTQVKPGDNTDHLEALGHYIVDTQPEVIVCIGDFADMASLSSYEKAGSAYFNGMSYSADLKASKEAMGRLLGPVKAYNLKQKKNKHARYTPRMVMCMGNHENRINRVANSDPVKLGSIMDTKDLGYEADWEVHKFLQPVCIDGITYCHYFTNPTGLTGHPVGGSIDNKLQKLGGSFVMGHQQTFQFGEKYDLNGAGFKGMVAGSFYSHDEAYLGPQKNKQHYRGFCVFHDVSDGMYDMEQVSMGRLMRNYGNATK